MKLVIATHNRHKYEEIKALLPEGIELLTLSDIGCREEIPETGSTLKENASQKSAFVQERFGIDCFADDTGLMVEALGGRPGVYSARYAGENASYQDNVDKLLREMEGKTDRRAEFRTVISLRLGGEEFFFEGAVKGTILEDERGKEGFGYDPVFLPEGKDRTFAQMTLEEKGMLSHRARAVEKLIHFLKTRPRS